VGTLTITPSDFSMRFSVPVANASQFPILLGFACEHALWLTDHLAIKNRHQYLRFFD
jgi:hypothetical protein